MLVDRRKVLALPALALVGTSAVPSERAHAAQAASKTQPPEVSSRIARFITSSRFESLPTATVAATKRSILDALGVSMAATKLEPTCEPFTALALEMGGPPESSLLAVDRKVAAAAAALANGSLAHALDYEDVHDPSGMHPNAAAVPAALAVAESRGGIDGREFITAIAVGCDLACRLGLARRFNLNVYGWYFPPIAGAFGATATVARLLRLNEREVLDALSLTLCQTSCSSELINNPETHVRAVRDGFAAQTAVQSVKLARAGVRGFDLPFEGKHAFATMYARGAFDLSVLTKDLGTRFMGEEISFKAWPACRGSHRYIQAALDFAATSGVQISQIESVTAYVTPLDEMLCVPAESKSAPSTAIDAKFSIPYTVATALITREVTLKSFAVDALKRPDVIALARRVNHQVDEQRVKRGEPILVIHERSGRKHELRVEHLLGSPRNPVTDEFLTQKFFDCAAYSSRSVTPDHAKRIATRVLNLESEADVKDLLV